MNSNKFLSPEEIVKFFDLQKGDHIADFGAGHGFFAIPMAKIAGKSGKVYAIDVQKNVLDVIRAKAKQENLENVEIIWHDLDLPEGMRIKSSFLEFVLISNVLFQAENKDSFFQEAYRILRLGSRLAVIDWNLSSQSDILKEESLGPVPNSRLGPHHLHRLPPQEVKKLGGKAGFTFIKEFPAGSHHFGLMFKK